MSEITNQQQWDEFMSANGSPRFGEAGGQFLQSWDWGELQKNLDRKIWRIGILENDQLVAATLVIKYPLPLDKNYLYSPRGPIFTNDKYSELLLNKIKNIAKKEKSIFYRHEPLTRPANKFACSPAKSTSPDQSLILNLKPSAEELLNSFHQKTRYNIRLAEKKGVTIRQGQGDEDFEIFWKLLNKTYSKQKIRTHPKDYYQKIFRVGAIHELPLGVKLYIAEYQNQPIAANLIYQYGNTATYVHGGSDYNHRQVMAPHLLQWQQIKDAKTTSFKYYDFWGFDEKKWPGVTRFKQGFNGKIVKYPGTFDLPLNKLWYFIYKLARKILK